MFKFKLPDEVNTVFDTLADNGFEGYLVGGCIRDLLMGKTPGDYDFAVSSLPLETEECFKDYRIIKTGVKHGTLTVKINSCFFELTTFRTDGEYLDSRHPSSVSFTPSLYEDLKRRDFTVNAIAYNPQKGITDIFNGQNDINNKIIKCVGNPDERFSEDALRILRALRFSSVLGFSIEDLTGKEIHNKKKLLKNVSTPRIYEELNKLICGNPDDVFNKFGDIFSLLIPSFSSKILLNGISSDQYLRYALILDYNDLKLLGADRKTFNTVKELQYYSTLDFEDKLNFTYELGKLKYASLSILEEYLIILNPQKEILLKEIFHFAQNNCISIKQLDINGTDLINEGLHPGSDLKKILDTLLYEVISKRTENIKTVLLKRVKELNR